MAEKTIDQLEYIALPEDLSTARVPININGQTVRTNIEDLVAKIKLQTFSRNIGEIVPSILPLNDAMLHLLDGGVISSIGVYSAFATYLNTLVVEYPNLFCDEATWQSINTTYGQCAKFVIDDEADTIRLPKITEYIKGVSSLSELGTVLGAGLPNITGSFKTYNSDSSAITSTSAFSAGTRLAINASTSAGSGNTDEYLFDASDSNAIYGNSDTVTPNTAKGALYLVLGNIVKTDIVVDIDQVITDLNLKADKDLSNISATGKNNILAFALPQAVNTSTDVGYIRMIVSGSGGNLSLPAGGTWAVFASWGITISNGNMVNLGSSDTIATGNRVLAGGTLIRTAVVGAQQQAIVMKIL